MIDQGNGAANGSGGIGRLAQTGPALVFGLLQQLQALGLDLPTVLAQLGVQADKPALVPKPVLKRSEESGSEERYGYFVSGAG